MLLSGILTSQKEGEFFEKSLEYDVPFTTTQYSAKNGLSQNQIIELKATPEGLLFLSTGNSIYTFNGYYLKEITVDKEYRLHFFRGLSWNEDNKLLLGYNSDGDLCRFSPDFKVILKGKKFCCLTNAGPRLLMGTLQGEIYFVTLPKIQCEKLNLQLPSVINALVNKDSLIYAACDQGLYLYNTLLKKGRKISNENFHKLKINPSSGIVYGITDSRVYEMTATVREKVYLNISNDEKKRLTDIAFLSSTEFYLSSRKGLYHYNNGKINLFTTDNGLASNDLYVMHYNMQQNCLFVGTAGKGLMQLQMKNAFSLYKKQGLSESSVSSIIKTHDDKILFAEICCNVHELTKDTIVKYLPDRFYYACLTEINNTLFCGTWGSGVRVIENKKTIDSITTPQLRNNTACAIYKDRKGNIWIGTEAGMSRGKDPKSVQPIFRESITSRINVIYELWNGDICLGGRYGFWIVNQSTIKKKIDKQDGLVSNAVRSFYEDIEGKLWVGTYGGGVYCYHDNKLTCLNSKKGCLLFEDAFCLAPDSYGNIYMTSNYGLWSIPLQAMNDFYKNKTSFLVPAHYTEKSGLLNTEFNGGFQNNYLQDEKDHFYFPTIEGIVEFFSKPLPAQKLQPEIESVSVNDSALATTTNVFERSTFLLKFKVNCINFSTINNSYFQYKLTGSSSDEWSVPQKENNFSFYLLPPGNYKLSVRAIDASNDKAPNEVTFEFKIKAHFYEEVWFKITSSLLMIVSLGFFVQAWIRRYQKKAEEKEFYARRIAEIELKAVQAQLNPHFIFNCLNTIKYFILDHDFEKANKGLNHFSKLLRDVLDNAEKFTISLQMELMFIDDYIELEKMRLQDQLSVTINNKIIDTTVMLPAMLIQPHIENAIKHGIANLETRKGILTISFTLVNSVIECRITDNGIGREAASRIKKLQAHISKGINLTKDKSDLLKKNHNIEIITSITDLYDKNTGEPLGTEVIIKIPVLHENSYN